MGLSRRRFVRSSGILLTAGLAGCAETDSSTNTTTIPSQTSRRGRTGTSPTTTTSESGSPTFTTPQPPAQPSPSPVLKEVYGELTLTPDDSHWPWEILSVQECVTLEYEVRAPNRTEFVDSLDILVLEQEHYPDYKDKVHHEPAVINGTAPFIHGELGDPQKDQSIQIRETIDALSTIDADIDPGKPVYQSATLQPGHYWIIFDWTDTKTEPTDETVSVEVAVRTKRPTDEDVEAEAISTISEFYDSFPDGLEDVIQTTGSIADDLCGAYDQTLSKLDLQPLNSATRATEYAIPITRGVLDALAEHLDFRKARFQEILNETTAWTQWSATTIPLIATTQEVIQDACTVADLPEDTSIAVYADRVEDFLLSLSLLVVELVLTRFGVSGQSARVAIEFVDDYVLGLIKQAVSFRVYLMLLRELYLIIEDSISAVLARIKEKTKTLAKRYGFFDEEDVQRVSQLNETDLLDLGDEDRFDFFDDDPMCS